MSPSGIVLYDNNYLKCIYRRVVLLLIVRIHIITLEIRNSPFFDFPKKQQCNMMF